MVVSCPLGVKSSPRMGKTGDENKCMETERCTRLLVRIVSKNVKCPLNHLEIGQYTARNVTRNIDLRQDIN